MLFMQKLTKVIQVSTVHLNVYYELFNSIQYTPHTPVLEQGLQVVMTAWGSCHHEPHSDHIYRLDFALYSPLPLLTKLCGGSNDAHIFIL